MVFSTNIGKQLVHMNYISTLVSATQHFHESYQVTCHGLGCLNWNSFNQNGGICDKINCNQKKEFMSQCQTQHTELFPTKINNLERYSLQN